MNYKIDQNLINKIEYYYTKEYKSMTAIEKITGVCRKKISEILKKLNIPIYPPSFYRLESKNSPEHIKKMQEGLKKWRGDYKGAAHNKLPLGEKLRRTLKTRSAKLNKEMDLTSDEILNLCKQNCFYCEEPPSKKSIGSYRYEMLNGLDRLNNNLGYTKTNSVPCCSMCNKMKNKYSLYTFLEKIDKIYKKHLDLYKKRK